MIKFMKLFKKKNQSIFSLEERLTIYRKAKEVFLSDGLDRPGMCFCIELCIDKYSLYNYKLLNEINFPEFFALKPFYKSRKDYWWPIENRQIRIKKFNKLIDKLTNKLIKPKWYDILK